MPPARFGSQGARCSPTSLRRRLPLNRTRLDFRLEAESVNNGAHALKSVSLLPYLNDLPTNQELKRLHTEALQAAQFAYRQRHYRRVGEAAWEFSVEVAPTQQRLAVMPDDQVLASLREGYAALGEPFSHDRYKEWVRQERLNDPARRRSVAGVYRVKARFGSWSAALRLLDG